MWIHTTSHFAWTIIALIEWCKSIGMQLQILPQFLSFTLSVIRMLNTSSPTPESSVEACSYKCQRLTDARWSNTGRKSHSENEVLPNFSTSVWSGFPAIHSQHLHCNLWHGEPIVAISQLEHIFVLVELLLMHECHSGLHTQLLDAMCVFRQLSLITVTSF